MAGRVPAIHGSPLAKQTLPNVDARVEPAHDESGGGLAY
jgi:hypothetical protein